VIGPRVGALLMGLGLVGACTRSNPAYRIGARAEDGAEVPGLAPDALSSDRPSSPADALAREDLSPIDEAPLPADLAPPAPDRVDPAPDLSPDAGVSSTGLVARWRLDEGSGTTVADSSGSGNTGTTRGGPIWASAGFPSASFSNPGALVLDGVDDYVEVTVKSIPGNAAPKTMCAWFKANNANAMLIRNLVTLINDTSDLGIQLGILSGRVAAWFYGLPFALVNAPNQVDGNWHHAAYTYDGRTHRIYYDGKLEASIDAIPVSGPITHVRLGTYQVPDEMFAGTLDDVRIYARPLSDAEVMALWNGQ
jgi:hypothetical protein